jgi:hypothetical protein
MCAALVDVTRELLDVSGIAQVISIDDAYAPGATLQEIIGGIPVANPEALQAVAKILGIEVIDPDILGQQLRGRWESLSETEQEGIAAWLRPQGEPDGEGEAVSRDLRMATALPGIFGDKVRLLSLKDWTAHRNEIVNDQMLPTLLLVDINFTDEGGGEDQGIQVISELLASEPKGNIYCALLSNRYQIESIHDSWKAVCKQYALPSERFVLIPKRAVSEDTPKFLSLIKLVVMNGRANSLKAAIQAYFEASVKDAIRWVEDIDIYEFEQIVCVSSREEGVWESDTLLRILSLLQSKFVKVKMHTDEAVHHLTDDLRNLSLVTTDIWGLPSTKAYQIQNIEWYQPGEEVNGQYLPTELGDIYEIKTRPDKRYILMAQPCDLMVRGDTNGQRHYKVKNAALLEAYKGKLKGDTDLSFELEYFTDSEEWRVDLRSVQYVCLEVLDLCALNSSGEASITKGMEISLLLSPPWRSRAGRLLKDAEKTVSRCEYLLKKGLDVREATAIATTSTLEKLFSCTVNPKTRAISYNFRRVGRLKQPRSGALLSKYANAFARDAFEHDLTDSFHAEEEPATPTEESGKS